MKTLEDKEFLISALNAYWNTANTELQKKDLGDIERKNFEYQLSNSKRLMVELEDYEAKLKERDAEIERLKDECF